MKSAYCFALAGALLAAAPSLAAPKPKPSNGPRACALSDVSPTAAACSGFFAGNLLNNARVDEQTAGLAALGFSFKGDFNAVTKINSLGGSTLVDFAKADQNPIAKLFGDTVIGLHFGNGAGLGGQATAFYRFDAGTAGLSVFNLGITQGSSGAVLYSTGMGGGGMAAGVPEPATWALMILGFGMVGASMRRRKPVAA